MIRLPLDCELIPSLKVPTILIVWPDSSETCPVANSPKLADRERASAIAVSGRPSATDSFLTSSMFSTSSSRGMPTTQIRFSDPSLTSRQ